MTARQVYEAVLVEMNKVQAPSLLLEDFNYLFNKAINQYINKRYNIYDINQQTTDDLRVLKSSVTLRAASTDTPVVDVTVRDSMYGAIYEFSLPPDYLHLLNCICNYRVNKPFKCYNANTYVQFPAQRLTSDMWSQIINNFYMRPSYKRPYYFIHNVNTTTPSAKGLWQNNEPAPYTTPLEKAKFVGDYGRVPEESLILPTDPGNIDIQHLERSLINSKYGDEYVNDINIYDEQDSKNGLPRHMTFYNYEIGTGGGLYLRTGKARIRGTGTYYTWNEETREEVGHPYYVNLVEFTFTPNRDNTTYKENYNTPYPTLYTSTSNMNYDDNYLDGKQLVNHVLDQKAKLGVTLIQPQSGVSYYELRSTTQRFRQDGTVLREEPIKVEYNTLIFEYQWGIRGTAKKFDAVERVGEVRYGNPSTVRLEIRYGKLLDYIFFFG